ncbi:hypothetical protein FO519_009279 [Halicephalobus sp. NKZ332]|nr:hypothetical protein FO519_009279 [Halicephalobus sp. NKZ332]
MPNQETGEKINFLKNQDCDVLIVGAGISGLISAREILKADPELKVIIIEGKNRVGGRTHTVELKCAGGETEKWDIGGQWVGETQIHIINLIKELDLETYDQHAGGITWMQIGSSKQKKYTIIPPVEDTRYLVDSVDVITKNLFGISAAKMSFLYFLVYVKSGGNLDDLIGSSDTGADAMKIAGGTQQISQKLCDIVGWEKIYLNQALLKLKFLDEDNGETHVEAIVQSTLDETKISKITAKRVILAIPPSECSKIRFQPSLPFDKKQLFEGFPQGHYLKFIATYEIPFWKEKGFSGGMFATGFTDNPGEAHPLNAVYDATSKTGKPALIGFAVNKTWSDVTPKVRKEAILQDLARFFGDEALRPVDYIDKDWRQEIFNGGCPTGIIPVGNMEAYARVREPWKMIHFAGTETATMWIGYMSGAVQSGRFIPQP